MKHLGEGSSSYLRGLLIESEIALSDSQQQTILRHLDWILDANEQVNLTAITHPKEAIRLHIVDSLLALSVVNSCPAGPLCDIGTGAGFPGIPLAVASARPTTLLESVQKKARIVSEFLASLEPGTADEIHVEPIRVEEYSALHRGEFAVVTARAVSQLGALIELSSPLLARNGALIALKGALSAAEMESALYAARLVGMAIEQRLTYTLPERGESRTLVIARKVNDGTIALPRRTGLAQRDPLGPASR